MGARSTRRSANTGPQRPPTWVLTILGVCRVGVHDCAAGRRSDLLYVSYVSGRKPVGPRKGIAEVNGLPRTFIAIHLSGLIDLLDTSVLRVAQPGRVESAAAWGSIRRDGPGRVVFDGEDA